MEVNATNFDAMLEADSDAILEAKEKTPDITIDKFYLHPKRRVRTIAEIYKGDIEREGFLRRGETPLDGSYFASILTESGKIFVYISNRVINMLIEESTKIIPTKSELEKIGYGVGYYKILARYI